MKWHIIYFEIPGIDKDYIERTIILWIGLENCIIKEIDQLQLIEAIKKLHLLSDQGIGGRDAIILTVMEKSGVQTLVTHDKDMLKQRSFRTN